MATTPANVYCSISDVEDVISEAGVDLATDDDPPSDYGGAIAKAGNQIDKYCHRRYTPEYLATSDLVKDWAAVLAAYFIRTRRGNPAPAGLQVMYDQTIADLEEIKLGRNEIPGIPARKSFAPVLSTMRSTLRPHPRAVVVKSRSSTAAGGAENYRQQVDPYDRYGWNASAFLDNAF